MQYVLLGIFLVLAFGLWRLQVAHSDYYASLAEQNRIKQVPILAPRGKILDREGRIIVDNYPSFSVLLLRDQKRDLIADADKIAAGLHIPPDELRTRLKRMAAVPGYQPLFLKDDITPDELAFIESHRAELPELDTITVHRRLYPRNGFMAHVIGYVGQVSEDMLHAAAVGALQPRRHRRHVGRRAVLQRHPDGQERLAAGAGQQPRQGSRHAERCAGRSRQAASSSPSISTCRSRPKRRWKASRARSSPWIRATAKFSPWSAGRRSIPTSSRCSITRDEWNRLITDPGKPLLNKAIQAQLAPGSVFKIIMATAGLQEGIAQDLVVNCGGGKTFYGRFFKCWIAANHGSHGSVSISKAIYQSCDSYFYTLAEKLGIGRIAKYATMLGLGQKTGVDLPQEVSGRDAVGSSGRSRTSSRSGMRARRFRSASGRARWRPRRFNWRAPSAPSPATASLRAAARRVP